MCFPLGPKSDFSRISHFSPPSHTLLKPTFISVLTTLHSPSGVWETRKCFTPTVCNLKTWAICLGILKPFQTGGGWGGSHSPLRSHSRTHARTHAGLSFLTALGQWLATLSVTQPTPRRNSL